MKEKVKCYRKCLKCGEIEPYIMRDKNVNNTLTDKDIHFIISNSVDSPYEIDHCECCDIQTLQMSVGWDY